LTGENGILFVGDRSSFDISGQVRSTNGTGIAGVEVLLEGSEAGSVLTDQQGYYAFTELPADGSYVVALQNGQSPTTPAQVEIDPLVADAVNVDFVLSAQTPPVSLSGRVLDSFGRGLRGVVVTVENSRGVITSSVTNSLGYYRFSSLVAGETYILSVSSRRYRFAGPTRIVNVTQDITNENFFASSP
jgi:Carboxypeptidase regulatory-like domain